jgi:hypothetical protein
MSAYSVFQSIVIACVVVWSVWFAARRLFPRSYRAAQAGVASHLVASPSKFLHALGTRIVPLQVANGAGCGSGGGCSSCGTCATPSASPSDVQPLVFHPRAKL